MHIFKFSADLNVAINDLTITSVSAAYKIPNLLVNRGLTLHNQQNCLSCYRLLSISSPHTSPKTSPIPKALREVIESFSTAQNISFDQSTATIKGLSNAISSTTPTKKSNIEVALKPEKQIPETEENKEIEGNTEEKLKEDNLVLEVLKRKEVLKLVGCMNATVGAKTAEQGLLRYAIKYGKL